MIAIRRARLADAPGIAAVHVATWRSAYANLLPDEFLANLSMARLTRNYEHAIRMGQCVHVAVLSMGAGRIPVPSVLGFSTASRNRVACLGDGELETLYVLDDYQNRGLGEQLLRASAKHLVQLGCRSVYAWVLSDNPARYFYHRMGGKFIATGSTMVASMPIAQLAFSWDPIETLLDVTA